MKRKKGILKGNNMIRKMSLVVMPFLFVIALLGCASSPKATSMQVANAVEVMGINWSQYQGRILRIESKGNEYTSAATVRENALVRATWEIHQLGLEYFMILVEDKDAKRHTYTSFGSAATQVNHFGFAYTTFIPGHTQNSTSYSLAIIVLGCSEDELINDIPAFSVNSRLEQAQKSFDVTGAQVNK
jgi:hypothetical protein